MQFYYTLNKLLTNDKMRSITLILVFLATILNAQENKTLDSLLKVKSRLTKELFNISDSIKKVDLLITSIESKKFLNKIKESSIMVFCKNEAKLKTNPHVLSPITATLPENTVVKLIDYIDGFLGVCFDTTCGYMNEMWIVQTEESKQFIEIKRQEKIEFESSLAQKKALANEMERAKQEKLYIKKYGQTIYNKLKLGKYWIGMDENMAIIALGYPNKINRTVTKYGVHEQWVYDETYLYFENGILATYQD